MPGSRRLLLSCGVLLSMSLLSACGSSGPQRAPTAAQPVSGGTSALPRSGRGNPPFYDVLGKRYHVLATSDGYHERGVASWYGRDFHGLATSSGETYDMHAMTAAHTTLPIPTWVEVTNLSNGKRVIVKVNDRGPFIDNRIIDLSYAAATELDMVRSGTTRVTVRALGAAALPAQSVAAASRGPAVSVAAPPAPPPQPSFTAAPQMFVQVGAFTQHDNAMRLVDRLKASGFANPVVVTDGRPALHRVRLGPIRDAQEFDQVKGRLRTIGIAESRLVVER
jgi:rare lipoprotein A